MKHDQIQQVLDYDKIISYYNNPIWLWKKNLYFTKWFYDGYLIIFRECYKKTYC